MVVEIVEGEGSRLVHPSHPFSRFRGLDMLVVDGVEAGAVWFEFQGDEAVLKILYIKPEERGKGYGFRFLEWLEGEARRRGLRRVRVMGGFNTSLYGRAGYARTRGGWIKELEGREEKAEWR